MKNNFKPGRGQKTREYLLSTGVGLFAKFGPEGISTRYLTKISKVNIAAIQYYFGTKEQYYVEVIKFLEDKILSTIFDSIKIAKDKIITSKDFLEKKNIFIDLIYNLVRYVLLDPNVKYFVSISSRENLNPTSAYEVVYNMNFKIHSVLAEIVGILLKIPHNSFECIIRTHALLGEIMLFRIGKKTLCRRLNMEDIEEEQVNKIALIISSMAWNSLFLGCNKGDSYDENKE